LKPDWSIMTSSSSSSLASAGAGAAAAAPESPDTPFVALSFSLARLAC
jgi:hypothetical protein